MKKVILYFCLFFVVISTYGQQNDPLQDEIKILTRKMYQDTVNLDHLKKEVTQFLHKVKKSQRKLLIGKAYYILGSIASNSDIGIQYLDSSLHYTKDLKKRGEFAIKTYIAKGSILLDRRDFQEALDHYLLAETKAKQLNNDLYSYNIKYNIACIKQVLGNYKEAEKLFKECMTYEETKDAMNIHRYLNTLYQLSSVYYQSGQVDKCSKINTKGVSLALKHNVQYLFYFFVVNEGVNLNIKGNYQASIDSLEKATPHLSEPMKLAANFYLAKSYHALGKKEKALPYFKKIDTVFTTTNDLWPPLRESYEYLIKDAKTKKDVKLQLHYTHQLLKVDSIIHADYKYLSHTITRKYDNPALIASRDHLIQSLEKDKEKVEDKRNWILQGSIYLTIVLCIAQGYYYQSRQKYKKYKKLYDEVIEKSNSSIEEQINVKDTQAVKVPVDIDETVVQEILIQLDIFEKKHLYLENQISLSDVAKITNTNSKYLSKIINSYKGKNFTTYINDLRIDYVIDRIQHDPMYQKYTINAIAAEGGFSNPQAFYRVFKKRTGLKPGYFIKKVKEDQQND